jgi:hypothetical protein
MAHRRRGRAGGVLADDRRQRPDPMTGGTQRDGAPGARPAQSLPDSTEWRVSVQVPRGVGSEEVDAVIRYLDYLDARLDTVRGLPAVTMIVRADSLEKARHYATERVLALIDAQPRP